MTRKQRLTRDKSENQFCHFYTGQEYDEETCLYNFRARLYDDDLFRFYAIDPAGQQFLGYAFVGNNPLIFVDPSGQWFFSAILPGIGTAIDAALWSATWGASISAAVYSGVSAYQGNFSWGGFFKAAGVGALGGALSAGIGIGLDQVFGQAQTMWGSVGMGAARGAISNTLMAWGTNQQGWGWSSLSGGLSGALGGYMDWKGRVAEADAALKTQFEKIIGDGKQQGLVSLQGGGYEPSSFSMDIEEERLVPLRSSTRNSILEGMKRKAGRGYSQVDRLGPITYDCSGAVGMSYTEAGQGYGNVNTAAFAKNHLKYGFFPETSPIDGDIVLFKGHMAMYDSQMGGGSNMWTTHGSPSVPGKLGVGNAYSWGSKPLIGFFRKYEIRPVRTTYVFGGW